MIGNGTGKTSTTVPHFLDTNVLVYAAMERKGEEAKRVRAVDLLQAGEFGVSTQVLQEFYTTVTRSSAVALSPERAVMWLERFVRLPCVSNTPVHVMRSIETARRYQISYWDAAIIVAAGELGATILYTEDLNHGQAYGTVTAINPFLDSPAQPGFHEDRQTALTKD
jgi:predicted nucleic acid-binding protein